MSGEAVPTESRLTSCDADDLKSNRWGRESCRAPFGVDRPDRRRQNVPGKSHSEQHNLRPVHPSAAVNAGIAVAQPGIAKGTAFIAHPLPVGRGARRIHARITALSQSPYQPISGAAEGAMRDLISSALFGLLPVPIGTRTYGDDRENRHRVRGDGQSPEHIDMMATELARLRSELGANVADRFKRRRARFLVLGKGWGARRIQLLLNHDDDVGAKARLLATLPGQSPVAVIDTNDCSAVTFYFADGRVCLAVRKPGRSQPHVRMSFGCAPPPSPPRLVHLFDQATVFLT